MNDDIAIRLSNVSKKYNLYNRKIDRLKESLHPLKKRYHRDFYAVKDINLEIKKGEILGIVGRNGSGKSTLLQLISDVLTPTSGKIEARGHISALLELGSGFNPEYTGLENIYFYSALMGYKRDQIDAVLNDILEFAELGDFIYQPLKTYSSGMKARLAFAVSVNVDPDILILDEVLAVGDELFRRKCYVKMETFLKGNKTILFVSHNSNTINQLCTRAILLERGALMLDGLPKDVTTSYQKLLFANEDEKSNVISDIVKNLEGCDSGEGLNCRNAGEGGLKDKISHTKNAHEKPAIYNEKFYIKGFVSTTVSIIQEKNIRIEDYWIEDRNGMIVNVLRHGERYSLKYIVYCVNNVKDVKFGAQIKDVKGVIISGANTKDYSGITIDRMQKGEMYVILYKFDCIMKTGNYFINIIVVASDRKSGVRVNDAIVFKVFPKDKINFVGYVTLGQVIDAIKIQ
ncbi:MAG: ABC transporter ATP-binding protein [Spirochaetes bacterium]|nr:ABC transporter ATP-binding protein [Spirochaetota bacterium]